MLATGHLLRSQAICQIRDANDKRRDSVHRQESRTLLPMPLRREGRPSARKGNPASQPVE